MKKLLALSLVCILVFGCKKNDNDCNYDACAVKAPASEIQAVKDYLAANNITTATEHCSGLFYKIEAAGSGTAPDACSYVTIKYLGKLTNGTIFDQTQGANTYSNYLTSLIRGWTNGVPFIKTGGTIHLYIPPTLGYGAADQKDQNGTVVIPGNSVIIFEVQLIAVN